MYHPSVIDREQHVLEKKLGLKLTRYEPGYSQDVQAHLQGLWSPDTGLSRQLTKDESAFVTNERLLCSIDFHYWARYAHILADASCGGGLQRFVPWESQSVLLDTLAQMELDQYEQSLRGEPQDGLLLAVPKARQEGVTMLARLLLMHVLTTTPHTLGICGSVDKDKVMKLWE